MNPSPYTPRPCPPPPPFQAASSREGRDRWWRSRGCSIWSRALVQRHLRGVWDISTSRALGPWWLLAPCLGVDASCDQRPPSLPHSVSLAFLFPPASLRATHPTSGQDAVSWAGVGLPLLLSPPRRVPGLGALTTLSVNACDMGTVCECECECGFYFRNPKFYLHLSLF